MKFTINRKAFSEQVSLAARVAPAKSPKPILGNLKLTAQEGLVVVEANNLDQGIKLNVPCDGVAGAGSTLVPAHKFSETLRALTCEDVTVSTTETGVLVTGGRSRVTLNTANVDEFPALQELADAATWSVQLSPFCNALKRVGFATSAEATRYAFSAVYMEVEGKKLHLVGTDGCRMSVTAIGVTASGDRKSALFPDSAVRLAIGLDIAGEATLHVNDSWVQIKTERAELHVRQVEGRFPRWRDVLPNYDGEVTRFSVSVSALSEAVSQVRIVTTEEKRGASFTVNDGVLGVCSNSDQGESMAEIPVACDGKAEVSLDPSYVADFLGVAGTELVEFTIRDGETAVLIASEGTRYVVMPLAV